MPAKSAPPPTAGGAGSARARLRLGAALLLGLLAATYLVLAVRLALFPEASALASGLVALVFALAALVYVLVTRAVVKQSRIGHILAAVVAALGAVFSLSAAMEWPDWVTLVVNLAAFGLLLGCVPRKTAAAS